jgi:hypothetical protein
MKFVLVGLFMGMTLAQLPQVGDVLTPDPIKYAVDHKDNIALSTNENPFRDLRKHNDQDFLNATVGQNEYTVGTEINLSSGKASNLYKQMYEEMKKTGLGSVKRYIVHTLENPDNAPGYTTADMNNKLVEEWDLSTDEKGSPVLSAKIHTKNVNNPTNPISTEEMQFGCRYYAKAEDYFCTPLECDFKPNVLTSTPAQKCVNHFEKSNTMMKTVFLAAEKEKEPTGSDTYKWIVECFSQKVEDLTFKGSEVCFYEGFEPENLVSLADLEKMLNEDGFYYKSDNTFTRKTVTEHHRVEVDVNSKEQSITDVSSTDVSNV